MLLAFAGCFVLPVELPVKIPPLMAIYQSNAARIAGIKLVIVQ